MRSQTDQVGGLAGARWPVLVALTIFVTPLFAFGDGIIPPIAIPPSEFGHLSHQVPGVSCGNVACGPVAEVNSLGYLMFLYPSYYPNLIPNGNIAAANELAADMGIGPNGVTPTQMAAGMNTYFNANEPATTITKVINTQNPTLEFLYDELSSGEDVELQLYFPQGGLHWVTLTGYTDTYNGTYFGNLLTIDPQSGAPTISATQQTRLPTKSRISYTPTLAPGRPTKMG